MDLIQSKKTVWLSGEICEASGIYFADTCGHKVQKRFTANDIFTRCAACQCPVRWIHFSSDAFETQKTLSFSKHTEFNFSKSGKKPEGGR